MATPLAIASLFSGAGGLDLGFEIAGFTTKFACDLNQASVATFNENFGENIAEVVDVAKIKPSKLVARIEDRLDGTPLYGVIAGPPCQGFSRGNVCRDENDPRNQLPLAFAKHLRAIKAHFDIDFFVFENVVGLAGPAYAALTQQLHSSLARTGFTLHKGYLDAIAFGVPQRRRRYFIVGFDRARFGPCFDFPTGRKTRRTVADAISGLPEPVFNEPGIPATLPVHPNHWTSRPQSAKFTTGATAADGRSFRRLEWDKPSPTIAYGNREIAVHPNGKRRISIFEAMLLQGFPRRFKLTGNLSQQVTQISNAVPPPLAAAIARAIRSTIANGEGL